MPKWRTFNSFPTSKGVYINDKSEVIGGLSMSVSDMVRATNQGRPISVGMDSNLVDGIPNPSFDSLPFEMHRGVDIADVWSEQKRARRAIVQAHNNDVNKYGV